MTYTNIATITVSTEDALERVRGLVLTAAELSQSIATATGVYDDCKLAFVTNRRLSELNEAMQAEGFVLGWDYRIY